MKKILLWVCLIPMGCATPLQTRDARLTDIHGNSIAGARVTAYTISSEFYQLAPSTRLYTDAETDSLGRFKLTTPEKGWIIEAQRGKTIFRTENVKQETDPILVEVVPFTPRSKAWGKQKNLTMPSSESSETLDR